MCTLNAPMVCACLHAACFNPTVLLHTGRRPGKQQTFCTLREPIDHLLSEFNFRAKPEGCNEPFLNNWVKTKLEKELMASRHRDDCHLLSSADYAHTCDYKVPYDHKHAGLALLLRVRFGIEFDMSTRLGGLTHQVHPMWDLRCHAKPHNLTTDIELKSICVIISYRNGTARAMASRRSCCSGYRSLATNHRRSTHRSGGQTCPMQTHTAVLHLQSQCLPFLECAF